MVRATGLGTAARLARHCQPSCNEHCLGACDATPRVASRIVEHEVELRVAELERSPAQPRLGSSRSRVGPGVRPRCVSVLLGLSAHDTFVERGHEHGSVSDEVLAAPLCIDPALDHLDDVDLILPAG